MTITTTTISSTVLILLTLLLPLHAHSVSIPNGDLIFLRPPLSSTSSLDNAILDTGIATLDWMKENQFNLSSRTISLHVALSYVASNGSQYFVQAVPPTVVVTPVEEFLHMIPKGTELFHGRMMNVNEKERESAILRALKQVGKPYSNDFQPPPNEFYCSSLVVYAYKNIQSFVGKKIFKLLFVPISFWTKYYQDRGIKLPMNVTGSNPTLLMHSPVVQLLNVSFGGRE